jgi:gliding motility-associated-like protein
VLKDCLTLTIPDAFSPNGDGTNDTYVIHNIEYYPENKLVVFNRWGNKVLERAPYNNDWDGTSQFGAVFGEKLPESTYYFVLDPGGDKEPITGYIYLRR